MYCKAEHLEDKYIDLLLKRCINVKKSKSLFVSYPSFNEAFAKKLESKAKELFGIEDIFLFKEEFIKKHDILKTIPLEEVRLHEIFNNAKWDEYAEKNASFLYFKTSVPRLMDDVESAKIIEASRTEINTRPVYTKKRMKLAVCIACLPNEYWANYLFPNDIDSYQKLCSLIYKMCMIDTADPIQSWNDFLQINNTRVQKLNELQIKKLHYQNSLGTDADIYLPDNIIWQSVGTLHKDSLANMPSYEIFTSPDYRRTNGIVYSAKPLVYANSLIDNFSIEFKNGKVVNYQAEIGQEILKGIIENDEQLSYLGEVALVDYDSPISKTGIIYGLTLFDENASSHLALGKGFVECIDTTDILSDEEILNRGINRSKFHIDFMIGTEDLKVTADTCKGKVVIFNNGKFVI